VNSPPIKMLNSKQSQMEAMESRVNWEREQAALMMMPFLINRVPILPLPVRMKIKDRRRRRSRSD
jgi:hypothetical protein